MHLAVHAVRDIAELAALGAFLIMIALAARALGARRPASPPRNPRPQSGRPRRTLIRGLVGSRTRAGFLPHGAFGRTPVFYRESGDLLSDLVSFVAESVLRPTEREIAA